ncbi:MULTISPECIES: DMT family transporter [Acidobacteriaceae]|uniref:DMT family transporter n=1 Tax=Acidobacteriaceae TaxID=204434 RepID=UPI00131B7CC7|nr:MULTISPECIES: DMT family transporter [Acidobacteriaceae]MDW5264351.1 DMT family transporter [Edaphobacter sp.]
MPTARPQQTRWSIWFVFFALCLLLSSSWLLPAGTTDESPITQQACFYSLVGLIALIPAYRRVRARLQWRACLRVAAVSILLLGVPAVLGEWARNGISDINRAALFALVPFVVVMVAAARESEPSVRRFSIPTLIGFGGVLLLLPFSFPTSPRGQIIFGVLLVAIALVGFASESLYRLLRGFGMIEALAVVALSNAVFLIACHLVNLPSAESWSGVSSLLSIHSLYNLVELLLLVWLVREMSPVRLAARYLIVPLFTVLEGFAFLHPPLTVRMAAGLALLIAGAAYLLLSRGWDSDAVLSIR